MTYLDIITAMEQINLDCIYHHYDSPPALPYTVIVEGPNADVIADGRNYLGVVNYELELYNKIKHPPTEKLVEEKLQELGLVYGKYRDYIPEEKLYRVTYEIQLIEE